MGRIYHLGLDLPIGVASITWEWIYHMGFNLHLGLHLSHGVKLPLGDDSPFGVESITWERIHHLGLNLPFGDEVTIWGCIYHMGMKYHLGMNLQLWGEWYPKKSQFILHTNSDAKQIFLRHNWKKQGVPIVASPKFAFAWKYEAGLNRHQICRSFYPNQRQSKDKTILTSLQEMKIRACQVPMWAWSGTRMILHPKHFHISRPPAITSPDNIHRFFGYRGLVFHFE